jgi:hypothetical protein
MLLAGLYYNGHTKVWYTFDNATQSYKEVHPDVATSAAPQTSAPAATTAWPQQQQVRYSEPFLKPSIIITSALHPLLHPKSEPDSGLEVCQKARAQELSARGFV